MSERTEQGRKTFTQLAKEGYTAFWDSARWKDDNGNPVPEWDDLPRTKQQHWIAAVVVISDGILG